MRTCRKCGLDKAAEEFRERSKGGRLYRLHECRACERAVSLAHARAHAQERRDYSRVYGREHAEERRAYRSEHGRKPLTPAQLRRKQDLANDRRRAMTAADRRARYDRWSDYFRERNARMRGATVIEDVKIARIVERDGSDCYLCRKPLTPGRDMTLDHVIPLSRGGPHTEANVKLACRSCNAKKRNKLLAA